MIEREGVVAEAAKSLRRRESRRLRATSDFILQLGDPGGPSTIPNESPI